jgi:hypothetical protein
MNAYALYLPLPALSPGEGRGEGLYPRQSGDLKGPSSMATQIGLPFCCWRILLQKSVETGREP